MSTPMTPSHAPLPMPGLAGLVAQLPGARVVGTLPENILRVHTDTRSLQAGDLFVALRGDRFDAHDFLPNAKAQGAVAALAEHGLQQADCRVWMCPTPNRPWGSWRSNGAASSPCR